jgi:hypothetical protein
MVLEAHPYICLECFWHAMSHGIPASEVLKRLHMLPQNQVAVPSYDRADDARISPRSTLSL